jgi:hypothetical protein
MTRIVDIMFRDLNTKRYVNKLAPSIVLNGKHIPNISLKCFTYTYRRIDNELVWKKNNKFHRDGDLPAHIIMDDTGEIPIKMKWYDHGVLLKEYTSHDIVMCMCKYIADFELKQNKLEFFIGNCGVDIVAPLIEYMESKSIFHNDWV